MGERHAYGTSLFCLSRRLFILGWCAVMAGFCYTRLGSWIMHWRLEVVGLEKPTSTLPQGCIGTQCYEVFSCFGMKDTTWHLREPLATLTGAFFYPMGFHGALHGLDKEVRLLGGYLLVLAMLHIAILVGDWSYLSLCSAYDENMMQYVLSKFVPPSPLRPADRAALQQLTYFSVEAVDKVTGNFNITAWYYALAGVWAAAVLYVAVEALRLSQVMEFGVLGLGPHFGLDQWDEVLNHEAIRRHKLKEFRSKFLDDALLPLVEADVAESGLGSSAHAGYGAALMASVAEVMKAQQEDLEEWSTGEENYEYTQPQKTIQAETSNMKDPFLEVGEFDAEPDEAEAEAEAEAFHAALAERLAVEDDSPEAILDRAFG